MIWLLSIFLTFSSFASELKLNDVLESTLKHHPKLLESFANLEYQKGSFQEETSNFDTKLNASNDQRQTGYYDGKITQVELIKPLKILNAKVYAGHRVSSGDFPIYESEYETLSKGENHIGISLSLLKNRSIDKNRLSLWNSKLKIVESNNSLEETKEILKNHATIAFYSWVAAGKKFEVYDDLVKIAETRKDNLKKRINKGDLAKIYLAENEQYLLKRKSKREIAKQKFQNASLLLSFYLRDTSGDPLIPLVDSLPKNFTITFKKAKPTDKLTLTNSSPIIKRIDAQISQNTNLKSLGETNLLPEIDLKLEQAQDRGQGPDKLRQTDNKISLNFSFPLERNLGKGKVLKAKAKINSLIRKKQYLLEKMMIKTNNLYTKILTAEKVIKLTEEELKLARLLEKSEIKKFDNGASDYFVVNLREQNTASANISLIESKYEYLKYHSEYLTLLNGVFPQ